MYFLAGSGIFIPTSSGFGGQRFTCSTTTPPTLLQAAFVSTRIPRISLFAYLIITTVSAAVFYVAKTKFLARLQPDKEFRWDYDFLEVGDGYSPDHAYGMTDFSEDYHLEDDEWTTGSSSSVSSGCRSPIEDTQSVWESGSETLAGHSDNEGIGMVIDDRR